MKIKQITQNSDISAIKKINLIAPLLNNMHTDPQFSFGFELCYVCRYLKHTSQQILDTGNLMCYIPTLNITSEQ